MNLLEFSFGNAVGHFQKTGGPKGFLWKFAVTYALIGIVLQGLSMYLMAPMYATAFNPAAVEDPDMMNQVMLENMGRVALGYLVSIVFGVLMWIMFEAASQRRYMRADGFSLKLGGDEGRLLVVGLIWFGLIVALYIGMFVVMFVPMSLGMLMGSDGAMLAGILTFILVLAYFVFAIWIAVRFSPAGAMTIRDRKIRFGSAWKVTKGRVWTLIGSWVVLGLIMMAIIVALYLVFVMIAMMALMPVFQSGSDDPSEILAAFTSLAFIIPALVFGSIYLLLSGGMMHVFGGPAALAAKTDPNWTDQTAVNDTFA